MLLILYIIRVVKIILHIKLHSDINVSVDFMVWFTIIISTILAFFTTIIFQYSFESFSKIFDSNSDEL